MPCAEWAAGMSASLRAGLSAASADAMVVHLVDLPDVPAAANPSRNSSALRRLGSGGTTVTGACG